MQQHALYQLIEDYTNTLALVGLELENHVNYYLSKRKTPAEIFQTEKSIEPQNNFFQFLAHNFRRWSVMQCEILIGMLKNDILKKGAECVYVRVECERTKDISIKTTYSQFKQKAIKQFNILEKNQQIPYLAYYLHESMQIFSSLEGGQLSNKYFDLHFGDLYNLGIEGENRMYLQGLNFNLLSKYTSNDFNEYSRSALNFGQNQGTKWQGKQGLNGQYNPMDAKNKNDIYKLALGNRGSQKQQKSQKHNGKGEESKQKSQFQTLKSLFKKLQNNA